MHAGVHIDLLQVSAAIAALTAGAAPLLTAIRVGPNRHISGFLWRGNTIVTSDQALPAQDGYSVVLASGALAPARPGPRDPVADLALLMLDTVLPTPALPRGDNVAPGNLALALGASFDGSPAVRLTMVHRLERSGASGLPSIILDLPSDLVDPGGPVLTAGGELLGMAQINPQGEASALPYAVIARICDGASEAADALTQPTPSPPRPVARVAPGLRRGWLGVALQPITVPEALVQRAGQSSARMVMNVTTGGPADRAGLRAGDVLLALNGHNTSGSHALRAFLDADRIGSTIEVRLLRDGALHTAHLTVAAQPAE
jgi:S1-C subfamily serine protease